MDEQKHLADSFIRFPARVDHYHHFDNSVIHYSTTPGPVTFPAGLFIFAILAGFSRGSDGRAGEGWVIITRVRIMLIRCK